MTETTSHPSHHARRDPDRIAYTMTGSGSSMRYGELEALSNQGARLLRACGLRAGDNVAVLLKNDVGFFPVYWAVMRAGLYFTPISWHSTAEEAAYILRDCGAKVVISSADLAPVADALPAIVSGVSKWFSVDEPFSTFGSWFDAAAAHSSACLPDETGGFHMLYSSGTTGRPKGIKLPFVKQPIETVPVVMGTFGRAFGFDAETIYLSPAPLYHASPLGFSATVMRKGGRVLIMEKFDAENLLQCIERYGVTHLQVVPTMFVRLLRLDAATREKYDTSSLRCAIHAAAPCPVDVKQQMIDWWGPVIEEFYSASEGTGSTMISSAEWLAHRGSVGRPLNGHARIVGDDGRELPPGEVGAIYFEGVRRFEYHNDPEKTLEAFNDRDWSTFGDMGYVDADGYLYLTDRKSNMIISGGVNVYPQEVESLLAMHPKVADVAVFGIPNEDFGEEVKAVVQPIDMATAGPALAAELISYCREHLSTVKCPRSVDFQAQLPRLDNGKLYKRKLRDPYWEGRKSRIV